MIRRLGAIAIVVILFCAAIGQAQDGPKKGKKGKADVSGSLGALADERQREIDALKAYSKNGPEAKEIARLRARIDALRKNPVRDEQSIAEEKSLVEKHDAAVARYDATLLRQGSAADRASRDYNQGIENYNRAVGVLNRITAEINELQAIKSRMK